MKVKIAITGAGGNIGTVLMEGLSKEEFDITPINLPQIDVRNYSQLLRVIRNQQIIIHLAWNSKTENLRNRQIDPDNLTMAKNAYQAALESGVKRIIMASSIHTHRFYGWKVPPLMSTDMLPIPDSPYGEDKIVIEQLGREFAAKGLEVVAIRFGGIHPLNMPPSLEKYPKEERAAWLSCNDCVSLIRTIALADKVPNNYVLMYAVSDNKDRIHDISNPFGWTPKESAEDF